MITPLLKRKVVIIITSYLIEKEQLSTCPQSIGVGYCTTSRFHIVVERTAYPFMKPAYCKVLWAEAFREACNVLVGVCDPTQANIHPEVYYALALERRITLIFIIPLLLLRQSPVKDENRSLSVTIKQRLILFKSHELHELIVDYEKDIVTL